MKKNMLNIDIRKKGEILELNPDEKNHNIIYLIVLKLANWILGYFLFAGILVLYHFLTGGIHYPAILIDSAVFLAILATVVIVSSAMSGTKLVVPGALVVYNKALLDDINAARARAFNVAGPFVGYIMAAFLYVLFKLE